MIAENSGEGDDSAADVRAVDVTVEYVPVSVLFSLCKAVDRGRIVLRLWITFASTFVTGAFVPRAFARRLIVIALRNEVVSKIDPIRGAKDGRAVLVQFRGAQPNVEVTYEI